MVNNTYKRLSIYTSSSCNLNCKYCYEKNYKMKINHPQDYNIYIDKLLYFNIKNKETLESIELWGGEPLLGLQEFITYLPRFLNVFPNLKEIKLSSNFTVDNSADLISMLLYRINEYMFEDRHFTVKLQISIDGPQEINDFNRGIGSTQKVLNNIINLNNEYNKVDLIVSTNSVFNIKPLYAILSYENMEEWFNFFLDNFPENIKFGLFTFDKENRNWTNEDGVRAANLLRWADQWRELHPEESKRFIWPDNKINVLDICSTVAPGEVLSMSPTGEVGLCHKAIQHENYSCDMYPINLTHIFDYMMDQYTLYKDNITLQDYRDSLITYINLMWCPYNDSLMDTFGEHTWFCASMPLYYNGAMQILLKWGRLYG